MTSSGWNSFWDLAVPEQAASAIIELYGAGATEAASRCAAVALSDDREEDYRFWIAVFARVATAKGRQRGPRRTHLADLPACPDCDP